MTEVVESARFHHHFCKPLVIQRRDTPSLHQRAGGRRKQQPTADAGDASFPRRVGACEQPRCAGIHDNGPPANGAEQLRTRVGPVGGGEAEAHGIVAFAPSGGAGESASSS